MKLAFLKALFGWLYFFSWSATFWPQVLLNFRRGTTVGLSHDFVALNVTGFFSYTLFTFCAYFVPAARAEYLEDTGSAPQMELQDVLFAAHGVVMTVVLVWQVFRFPPGPTAKRWVSQVSLLTCCFVGCGLLLSIFGHLNWVTLLETCGTIKVLSSIVKHFPQLASNISRKSTTGWSFPMVLLDVMGGCFSLAQQFVRCLILGNARPFTANLSKTFLAVEALAFDIIFIVQHVCIYTDRRDYAAEAIHSAQNRGSCVA